MKKMIHVTLLLVMAIMSFKADANHFPLHKKILKKELIRVLHPLDRPLFLRLPDLVVQRIHPFQYLNATGQTLIKVTINNIGNKRAGASYARVIDHSTHQSTGAPYNDVSYVPALNPGQSYRATFHLPYWIYNPNASLKVSGLQNSVRESKENNNTKLFYMCRLRRLL